MQARPREHVWAWKEMSTPSPTRSRPLGLRFLTGLLLVAPLLHAAASLAGLRMLNFGSPRHWDSFVYFVIAPWVGVLLLRRHPRARFATYVFLSCELLRGFRLDLPSLVASSVLAILYLQLPQVRRIHPRIRPSEVLERMRLRRAPVREPARDDDDSRQGSPSTSESERLDEP